jgi:hypothetical protein
VYSTN